ncbi:hypothetical protein ANN_00464 [Periplaneta americana]|uniref:Uncharacterized protein n=1 Tax=Periplaneta americana TaxID=6978 RepID=A0ABQ8TR30_PERAM|nr:hypothetical protein ANN_00464 [Periplaneta americana]
MSVDFHIGRSLCSLLTLLTQRVTETKAMTLPDVRERVKVAYCSCPRPPNSISHRLPPQLLSNSVNIFPTGSVCFHYNFTEVVGYILIKFDTKKSGDRGGTPQHFLFVLSISGSSSFSAWTGLVMYRNIELGVQLKEIGLYVLYFNEFHIYSPSVSVNDNDNESVTEKGGKEEDLKIAIFMHVQKNNRNTEFVERHDTATACRQYVNETHGSVQEPPRTRLNLFRCYSTPSSEPTRSRRYLNFAACCVETVATITCEFVYACVAVFICLCEIVRICLLSAQNQYAIISRSMTFLSRKKSILLRLRTSHNLRDIAQGKTLEERNSIRCSGLNFAVAQWLERLVQYDYLVLTVAGDLRLDQASPFSYAKGCLDYSLACLRSDRMTCVLYSDIVNLCLKMPRRIGLQNRDDEGRGFFHATSLLSVSTKRRGTNDDDRDPAFPMCLEFRLLIHIHNPSSFHTQRLMPAYDVKVSGLTVICTLRQWRQEFNQTYYNESVAIPNNCPWNTLTLAASLDPLGTWLDAVNYYAEYYGKIMEVTDALDSTDSSAVAAVKSLPSEQILEDILFIDSNLKLVSKSITLLESSKLQLSEALNVVDKVSQTVIQNNNSLISEKVKCKLRNIIDKNCAYSQLRIINYVLPGHDKTSEVGVLKSSDFPFFEYAPITSCDVERTVTLKKNETILGRRKLKFYSAVHSIST